MKTGIFYGSSTGNTADIAERIAKALGIDEADVHNIAKAKPEDLKVYDALVLGSSTWGAGELQDDWFKIFDALSAGFLTGKKVAVFGCGDSSSYADTFCNAVKIIYDAVSAAGAQTAGEYEPQGYDVTDSDICKDGKFVGLAIDDNTPGKTKGRIEAWAKQLKAELA